MECSFALLFFYCNVFERWMNVCVWQSMRVSVCVCVCVCVSMSMLVVRDASVPLWSLVSECLCGALRAVGDSR